MRPHGIQKENTNTAILDCAVLDCAALDCTVPMENTKW